jgi:hypothetical protein
LDGGFEEMSIAAGTKLGRYEIRSQIGEGGMGEVYLAEDIFDFVRPDPRFQELQRRVGLPQ